MQYFLIKSNQGNHSGFNRKWSIESYHESKKDARIALIDFSLDIALTSNHLELRNKRAYDPYNKQYMCTNKCNSFSYDGYTFCIVSIVEYNKMSETAIIETANL